MISVAINGFGRIGRLALRALVESGRQDIQVVAINDLGSLAQNCHQLKYDSIHGAFPGEVCVEGDTLCVNGTVIKVLAEADPSRLPWANLDVDVVYECSGRFTKKEDAAKHLSAGAKRVLISAPSPDADLTVVYGVNADKITADHKVVSNASCTTNCLAPVVKVLDDAVGFETGFMTTIHAYTADQNLVDSLHSDPRRGRAAALSMIPTSTGAAKAVGKVLPHLEGRIDGTAIRVPTPNVSAVDLTFTSQKKTTVEELHAAIEKAAATTFKGVLGVTKEPLVSIDFNHNPCSSVFDLTQTYVLGGNYVRVLMWYDNEWGFANRMSDVASALMR